MYDINMDVSFKQFKANPFRNNLTFNLTKAAVFFGLVSLLAACGGGGGGSSTPTPTPPAPTPPTSGYTPGVFKDASTFDAMCQSPRSGADATTGVTFPDVQGSSLDEKNWIRSWNNNLYLWYRELPDIDPALHTVPIYFDLSKTSAQTPSGAAKDNFHGTRNTAEHNQLFQSGVAAGYGAELTIISRDLPRKIIVAYTQPNSPATASGVNLLRGTEIVSVDGVNVSDGTDVDTLNAGLFPTVLNQSHSFEVRDVGATSLRTITMTTQAVTISPVQNVKTIDTPSGKVGYFFFTDHIATAEKGLVDAVTALRDEQITDLVLDLRYNGGGFLTIANQLAYMIAGPADTVGQTFNELQFNDKHRTFDPVTGTRLAPIQFENSTVGFSVPSGTTLPSLNLSRVFVLTSGNTCSASEAVMNGLRGVNLEVIQIGGTTCGKPYGFYPQDNCGTTYFSIQFRGVNAKNFGDYSDGFSPANATGTKGVELAGCAVADDFTKALGDPSEARFAAALGYRADQTCPAVSGSSATALTAFRLDAADGEIVKPIWLKNIILGR